MRRRLALCVLPFVLGVQGSGLQGAEPEVFPGTQKWENRGEPSKDMVEGLHRYFDRLTTESIAARSRHWKRDTSSAQAYAKSIQPQREHLRKIIGSEPVLPTPTRLEVISPALGSNIVAENPRWTARQVRWSVYANLNAEGLWLEPKTPPVASIVAIPDCDVRIEMFAGIEPGLSPESQIARQLADRGCRVLIPTLLSRSDEHSGSDTVRMTNLSHREWVYRQAFETGRHLIGYEVDEVLAAVAWLEAADGGKLPIAVVGQGEGGSIALHAAALDSRIQGTWIGGYFSPRENVWREPIDRNVWSFLDEFGAAELASMVAPRALLIEACEGPEVAGPRPTRKGRADAASGSLHTPKVADVRKEFDRFLDLVKGLDTSRFRLYAPSTERAPINEEGRALRHFFKLLLGQETVESRPLSELKFYAAPDPNAREARVLRSLVDHTQSLIRTSELRRTAYWSKADARSPEAWDKSSVPYRQVFWEQLIGKLPAPSLPANARSIKILDEPKWTGYAIKLDLDLDVVASGVLLWPKDMKPGERRPVVVCQHGLEGTPDPIVDRKIKSVYNSYGAQLADRGYIVYAPQNPYIGVDRFRTLQRKANPLKASLFSVIVRQHERTLEWLSALPQVDPQRIAFYGLSYGGKTAMRVPAILTKYCLSICSADFNEWVVKTTNIERQYSYLFTIEYDMYEFGLAETANYAEMAALISPRPFMVERGHQDGVAPDEWIGYEFAKVRRHYDMMGIGDRAEIAYFNDGHQIDGRGSFAFLAKHLNWPRGLQAP